MNECLRLTTASDVRDKLAASVTLPTEAHEYGLKDAAVVQTFTLTIYSDVIYGKGRVVVSVY